MDVRLCDEHIVESVETLREKEPLYCSSDQVYTYSDYLQLPDEESYYYEFLDGSLGREPAPTPLHQRVSYRLHRHLNEKSSDLFSSWSYPLLDY